MPSFGRGGREETTKQGAEKWRLKSICEGLVPSRARAPTRPLPSLSDLPPARQPLGGYALVLSHAYRCHVRMGGAASRIRRERGRPRDLDGMVDAVCAHETRDSHDSCFRIEGVAEGGAFESAAPGSVARCAPGGGPKDLILQTMRQVVRGAECAPGV